MTNTSITTRSAFSVPDGTELSYLEAGRGPAMVLVPGWSQSAAEFVKQIDFFAAHFHVYALDHRGHGESGKSKSGYRITRLAADLNTFITTLQLTDVVLLGHSMGCAVIWAYWDQFDGSQIQRLVLVDQPAVMTQTPLWSETDRIELGAPLTPDIVFHVAEEVAGPNSYTATARTVSSMVSPTMTEEDQAWILAENLKTPRAAAARLFTDEAFADWRDVVPTIDVPTLVTAGESSLYPVAGPAWVAANIPGARLRVFTTEETGSHFVFWENPGLFNAVVLDFLTSTGWPLEPRSLLS